MLAEQLSLLGALFLKKGFFPCLCSLSDISSLFRILSQILGPSVTPAACYRIVKSVMHVYNISFFTFVHNSIHSNFEKQMYWYWLYKKNPSILCISALLCSVRLWFHVLCTLCCICICIYVWTTNCHVMSIFHSNVCLHEKTFLDLRNINIIVLRTLEIFYIFYFL